MRYLFVILFLALFVKPTFSQTYIELNNGEAFWGDLEKNDDGSYSCEKEDRIIKFQQSQIKLIETEEGGVEIFAKDKIVEINTDNYSGLLYAKGNNIYVPYSSTKIIIRSGSKTIRELLTDDGYWNIVGCPEEAHCIIWYAIDYSGSDKAYLKVCDKSGKELWTSKKVSARDFIPHHAGEESAEKLYKKEIKKLKQLNFK